MSGKKKPSTEQVLASLRIGNPKPALVAPSADSARAATSLEANESLIRLHIDSVVPYRRNPRKKVNERYIEIKESIRDTGKVDNTVKVTKRPGEEHYFPAAGGNTRLLALKDLYAEGDKRFEYVDFIFTEYKGEADVLTRHFIENDLRSDLIFWNKAESLEDLKAEIETEKGIQISSHRQFSDILSKRGIKISREVLRTYAFALEKLADLGAATERLSKGNVRETILPNYQKLIRLVDKFGIKEDKFHEDVVRSVLRQTGERFAASQEFSLDEMFRNLTDAAAALVNVDAANFRRMLSILEQRPDVTLSELTAPPDDPAAGGIQAASTTASSNPDAATDQSAGGSNLLTSDMNGNASAEQSDGSAAVPDLNTGGPRAGKSTEVLFANNLTPGDQTRPRQENPTGTLDLQGGGSAAESNSERDPSSPTAAASSLSTPSAAPLPTSYDIGASADVRAQFLSSLRAFAQVTNLEDAVRFDDSIPLWFYVDLPATAGEGIPLDIESQAGGNPYRYLAWWFLANLAGIFDAQLRNTLPTKCDVAVALADDELWDDAVRNVVGEPLYEDTLGRLISWQADPANPAGEALHRLLATLRSARAAFPDRFTNAEDQSRGAT